MTLIAVALAVGWAVGGCAADDSPAVPDLASGGPGATATTATTAPAPTPEPTTEPTTDPTPVPTTDGSSGDGSSGDGSATDGPVPEGFGVMAARVTTIAGEVCEVCLWLADDDALRRRGLMGVEDLGGLDGMAFVYDQPHTTRFTMRNTLLPLTIVFYGPGGDYLDAFDMEPCRAEPCEPYPTPADFTVAVEVPQGAAADLGMVPGSTFAVVAGDCPLPGASRPTTAGARTGGGASLGRL